MKKFLSENEFIFVAIVITIILGITSICVNFIRQKNIKDISADNTNVKYSLPQKYYDYYEDLYSSRASLTITNYGNYIGVGIIWPSSAETSSGWSFKCQYSETSNSLVCYDGEEDETYPTLNGVRVDDWAQYDENKLNELEPTTSVVKENLKATFYIIEGKLKETLENMEMIDHINWHEDIIIRTSFPDLQDCIFAKNKGYDTTNFQ